MVLRVRWECARWVQSGAEGEDKPLIGIQPVLRLEKGGRSLSVVSRGKQQDGLAYYTHTFAIRSSNNSLRRAPLESQLSRVAESCCAARAIAS